MTRQGYSVSQFSPTADAESSFQRNVVPKLEGDTDQEVIHFRNDVVQDCFIASRHFGDCFVEGESGPSKGEVVVGHGAGAVVSDDDNFSGRQRGLLGERLNGLVC